MTNNQFYNYIELLESGKQLNQRQTVLRVISHGHDTLVSIQRNMPTPTKMSSVSGRVSELLDEGLVKETDPGHFKMVTNPHESHHLSHMRKDAKYRKWVKQGEEMGWFKRQVQEHFS